MQVSPYCFYRSQWLAETALKNSPGSGMHLDLKLSSITDIIDVPATPNPNSENLDP
jgi:hypothetical protein